MFGSIDYIQMQRRTASDFDDQSVEVRKIAGDLSSHVVVFLPWSLKFETAKALHILPRHYFACYEMPPGIVSSTPHVPVSCLRVIEAAFEHDCRAISGRGEKPLLVAMSMGNFPATYLANKFSLDLISIASGHRGDWLTFHSPAAAHIRRKAEAAGWRESDFTAPIEALSPIANISGIGKQSRFLIGDYDVYIPSASRALLMAHVRKVRPDIAIRRIPFGHLSTIMLWRWMINMPTP
jgi:hypothetical protein